MNTLFVTKKVKISRENRILKIEGESYLNKVPISLIDNIYIFGSAYLNYGAKRLLLENSKEIYYFSHKGNFLGVLTNTKLHSNYRLRLLQYKHINDTRIAKFFVKKKIETIEQYTKKSLNRYKEKLKQCQNLNEILGIEGKCSLFLFEKIKEILTKQGITEFQKREFRPVKDRVNGLLSFAYHLYHAYLHSKVLREGFDPYLAFLHKKRGSHMAFVSDIMEGYRTILSAFIVSLLINQKITSDDFDELYLNYEGRKKFIKFYLKLIQEIEEDKNLDFLTQFKEFLKSENFEI
jgi:CRISPR-associated endonuclease Cas1